ncbi:LysR family transcriptional regulator [Variovorax sp. J31P207]|uniref:LysR family transcriptional regulator n=1 Tax=Variovorax sp. J31P207 TaxID=3053510 RepID=UPI0025754CFA|nr:LysR family transcriptional regulator [Variovorax sp. J31P207]MDM0069969.1 LysR family transcriptional regulator [Variovorax sp. J31P207]
MSSTELRSGSDFIESIQVAKSSRPSVEMLDLNDLRVFAYVAALTNFSLAANALGMHKSSVSRSIARLEMAFGAPLIQRTTRKVLLTRPGIALNERCVELLANVSDTIGYVHSFKAAPFGEYGA